MADRSTRYPQELRERVIRLVAELWPDHATEWEAMRSVAEKLGIGSTETVRKWVRRAEVDVDAGAGPGVSSEESAELRWLKAEVSVLALQLGDPLRVVGGGSRPDAAVDLRLGDPVAQRLGVDA